MVVVTSSICVICKGRFQMIYQSMTPLHRIKKNKRKIQITISTHKILKTGQRKLYKNYMQTNPEKSEGWFGDFYTIWSVINP